MTDISISTGGCLCGNVRFKVTGPPNKVGTCHCRMCQKWTGSVYAVGARFPESAFQMTKGEMGVYKSEIMERGFCTKCGSPFIYWYLVKEMSAGNVWISLGNLDEPGQYKPTYHYAVESEMAWIHDDLPRMRLDEDAVLEAALKLSDDQDN